MTHLISSIAQLPENYDKEIGNFLTLISKTIWDGRGQGWALFLKINPYLTDFTLWQVDYIFLFNSTKKSN